MLLLFLVEMMKLQDGVGRGLWELIMILVRSEGGCTDAGEGEDGCEEREEGEYGG